MCGLFGWQLAGRIPASLPIASAVLCQCMSTRGNESWGVLAGAKITKGLRNITHAPYARKLGQLPVVAAHTRYATTGSLTVENAHPFRVGAVIGMHNGIINDHDSLNLEYGRDFTVDSQHIFGHIDEGRPLSELTGYGAVVYARLDSPGAIFMGRFNDGELSVARISDSEGPLGIMWASTSAALESAVKLAGLHMVYVNVQDGKLYRVEGGEIYHTQSALDVGRRAKALAKWSGPLFSYSSVAMPDDEEGISWRKSIWDDPDPCSSCGDAMDECTCGSRCCCPTCLLREDDETPTRLLARST